MVFGRQELKVDWSILEICDFKRFSIFGNCVKMTRGVCVYIYAWNYVANLSRKTEYNVYSFGGKYLIRLGVCL